MGCSWESWDRASAWTPKGLIQMHHLQTALQQPACCCSAHKYTIKYYLQARVTERLKLSDYVLTYFKQLLWVICVKLRVDSVWCCSQTIEVKITRTTRSNYNDCVFLTAKIEKSLHLQQHRAFTGVNVVAQRRNKVHKWTNRSWPHRYGTHHLSRVVTLQTAGRFSEASRQVENSQLCLFPNVSERFLRQYRCAAAAPEIECQFGGRYLHRLTWNIKEWREYSCFLLTLIRLEPRWVSQNVEVKFCYFVVVLVWIPRCVTICTLSFICKFCLHCDFPPSYQICSRPLLMLNVVLVSPLPVSQHVKMIDAYGIFVWTVQIRHNPPRWYFNNPPYMLPH